MTTSMMTQLIKFVLVGSLAALTHLGILHLLVTASLLQPLMANAAAFMVAFIASYTGQSLWTFNHKQHNHKSAAFRFLITQLLCGFVLNQGLYTLLLNFTHLNYLVASVIVLVTVPFVTFSLSKYWAFK